MFKYDLSVTVSLLHTCSAYYKMHIDLLMDYASLFTQGSQNMLPIVISCLYQPITFSYATASIMPE